MNHVVMWSVFIWLYLFCHNIYAADSSGDYAAGLSISNQNEQNIWLDYSRTHENGHSSYYYFGQTSVIGTSNELKITQISYSSSLQHNDSRSGFEYQFWGQTGELLAHSFIGISESSSADSTFLFQPRLNWIRLYTSLPGLPVVDILSPGFEVVLDNYKGDSWLASWTMGLNIYSKDTSKLSSNPKVLLIFSPRTLGLAYTFNHYYLSYDLSYGNDDNITGINISFSKSAIDNSSLGFIMIYGQYLYKSSELELSVGTDSGINVVTVEIGISYYW